MLRLIEGSSIDGRHTRASYYMIEGAPYPSEPNCLFFEKARKERASDILAKREVHDAVDVA